MVILLFGPPGCGKGTQAAHVVERMHIPVISTGEMFRAECLAGTRLGNQVRSVLAHGELLGDELVNAVVASRIARPDCASGFLLDGYPRTVPQARYFSRLVAERDLPEPAVIHIDVPADGLVKRLTARRQCPQCHRIYNLLSQPPQSAGVCDDDGAALITREDDSESVIRDRMRAYQEQTGPVLAWFGRQSVHRVDGSAPVDAVGRAIEQLLSEPALIRCGR